MFSFNNPFIQADQQAIRGPQNQGNSGGGTSGGETSQGGGSGMQPGGQGTPNSGNQGTQNIPGNNQGGNTTQGGEHDPLHDFQALWQPNVDKDGKPIQNQDDATRAYLPAIDPQKFGQMVEKMDFTRSITPEDWQAVQAGGEGASRAMANVLNKTVRQSFATMFQAMTKIVETGFSGARERFLGDVPGTVREIMIDNSLYNSNPIIKNPAFAPLVKTVRQQYLDKFPKAAPAEVDAAVNAYFEKMYQDMEAAKKKGNQGGGSGDKTNADRLRTGDADANFEDWLSSELGSNSQQ